ncbi:MAG: CPBP family intramembrane metalloprotease [Bacteroidales bacterium]|nr:CPBP family intramembrane metalloprotease [Bacteroidales bacterium]
MKPNKLLSFFLILFIVLAVFFLNMTFSGMISGTILMVIRIVLIVLFFIAYRLFHRKKQTQAENITFTLMVINLAFFIVSFFTVDLWNLNLESARGIALAKLSDSFFISLVLIVSFLIGGYKLKDIYLAKGRLSTGLIIGVFSFILMGLLALNNPEQPIESVFLTKNLVWILLFVFSNGFMEELLFRGIFLKQFNDFLKPVWSVILTAIVFAASHMQVTYAPDILIFVGIVLILGLIWGFLMHYTKSMIASMLFHAGADLMIIIPVYSSFGVNG